MKTLETFELWPVITPGRLVKIQTKCPNACMQYF